MAKHKAVKTLITDIVTELLTVHSIDAGWIIHPYKLFDKKQLGNR